jgi:hypothetical protein
MRLRFVFASGASALGIAQGPAILDPQIAALDPTQLLQSLLERHEADLHVGAIRRPDREHADPPHPLGLLRARSERP